MESGGLVEARRWRVDEWRAERQGKVGWSGALVNGSYEKEQI